MTPPQALPLKKWGLRKDNARIKLLTANPPPQASEAAGLNTAK